MLRTALAACLLLAVAAPLNAAEEPFFFKEGDRVLFLGDSITEQYQYSTYLELYLTTRFPEGKMSFLNAGIGGDTANGGANRFATHVLAEKPTAITINFGMNDGGYGTFNENANKTYVARTTDMLTAAKNAGVRVALVSPNAVDKRVQERFKVYLDTQKQFYAPLKGLAEANGAAFVDQYAVTRSALEKMEADDPMAKTAKPFGDGFHTSSPGGLLMAHAILTGLRAPALVSRADIDAAAGTGKGENCEIAKVEKTTGGVRFERLDKALPMPVQTDWVSMLPYTNKLADLNAYVLKVGGLKAGKYALEIDGMACGEYDADALAKGVDLGTLTTGPVHAQGQKVLTAINAKNKEVHGRFRGVVMTQLPEWVPNGAALKQAELEKRAAKIAEMQAEVYKLAKPEPRRFELKPVG